MLRIDAERGRIPTDYHDPYLELVHLLTEAAAIEHSLMLVYLYALFSIKQRYAHVRGDIRARSFLEHSPGGRGGTAVLVRKDTFLDVALEEMQHLSLVNRYLADLGAAPNFTPHDFPYTADLYPFDLELRSLDQYVAATYLWIEADACSLSLSPACRKTGEPVSFVRNVRKILQQGARRRHETAIDRERQDHVGSLYHRIVQQTQIVAADPPAFLAKEFPWGDWENRMSQVLFQGELSHYRFFRSVFTGEAFGGDEGIWKPGPRFPAHRFAAHTAYTARPHTIRDEKARRVAWLGNLHYWIILALLDLAYRHKGFTPLFSAAKLDYQYRAIDNMTMGLWVLGEHLAEHYGLGVPFDAMGPQYGLGRSHEHSLQLVARLIQEAERHAEALQRARLLPRGFNLNIYSLTLDGLVGATRSTGA
jgi:hypothetical protein